MNLLQETLVSLFSSLHASGSDITIGELLDGLRLADHIVGEAQIKDFKTNLKLLWRVTTDAQVENGFERAWDQVEWRIRDLLARVRDPSSLYQDAASKQQLEPLPMLKPVEIAETTPKADVSIALFDENSSEIKPPVEVKSPVDPSTEGNGSYRAVEENGGGRSHADRQGDDTSKKRGGHSPRHFTGRHRFKFKVATDAPQLQPPVGVVPVGVPPNLKVGRAEAIFAYTPISRLSMTYMWRYLRRPVADGPANVLDIEATIEQVAHQGFFLTPVYRRWQSNHAHLMFLIDQNGSMSPFHSVVKDLVDTACEETSIKQVDVFYFHNVFDDRIYKDDHLTSWMTVDDAVRHCTANTSILIVSDAGAARGYRNNARLQTSRRMIIRLQQSTDLIAWLNPMPRDRWIDSSAELIANEIQMFELDTYGFSSAVDVLQGRGITS